jgi:hypothetical protein
MVRQLYGAIGFDIIDVRMAVFYIEGKKMNLN